MQIDEAIKKYKLMATAGNIMYAQTAEWLEELKLLREELKSHILHDKELAETKMFQLGYNKAIDDIAVTLMDIIEERLEQLKEV